MRKRILPLLLTLCMVLSLLPTAALAEESPAPEVPVVTGDVTSTGQPLLRWREVEGATAYEVWRAVGDAELTYYHTTNYNYFTNTSAEPLTTYTYQVRSVGADGARSEFCPPVSITTPLPIPRVSLEYHEQTGRPRLRWEAVEGAVAYEIWRGIGYGSYYYYYTTEGPLTFFNNISATPGQSYQYKVRALSEDGTLNSGWSYVSNVLCRYPAPKLSGTRDEDGTTCLTWTPVDGARRYEVWRSANGGEPRRLAYAYEPYFEEMIDPGTVLGVSYTYQVRAVGKSADTAGPLSNRVTLVNRQAPEARIALNANGKPKLTWSSAPGAEAYVIYRAVGNGEFAYYYTTNGPLEYFNNISATPGVTYRYQVQARMLVDPEKLTYTYSVRSPELVITSQ